jgi:hypothetical protein
LKRSYQLDIATKQLFDRFMPNVICFAYLHLLFNFGWPLLRYLTYFLMRVALWNILNRKSSCGYATHFLHLKQGIKLYRKINKFWTWFTEIDFLQLHFFLWFSSLNVKVTIKIATKNIPTFLVFKTCMQVFSV